MRIAGYSFIFLILVLSPGCNKSDLRGERIKTLDSLSGSINSMVGEFEKTDTVLLQRSITRFGYYKRFIKENIHDTITKDEADQLKHFYSGGEGIEFFFGNRKLLLERARLVNSQLLKLKEDLNNAGDVDLLSKFLIKEQKESSTLTEAGYRQQELFHKSFEEFKNSLNAVEALIRSRNSGDLPTIIKDTIIL